MAFRQSSQGFAHLPRLGPRNNRSVGSVAKVSAAKDVAGVLGRWSYPEGRSSGQIWSAYAIWIYFNQENMRRCGLNDVKRKYHQAKPT